MDEAPKRIWLDWPDANRGDVVYAEPPERDTQPGQTGYVRADLVDILRADRDSAARMWQASEQEREAAVDRAREASQYLAIETQHAAQAEARAEKAENRNKELVMQSLADLGQAQEAYEAQKKAEALSWRLRSYAVHDDDCTRNRHPHYRGCSCGLQKLLDGMAEQTAPDVGAVNKGEE